MYETHYGLRELPFTLAPDPAFLYPSKQHQYALTLLRYGIVSRAGFCLLTGEVGSGKTLLLRQLLASLEETISVGLIAHTNRRIDRLLPWVCEAFGLDHSGKDDASLYGIFTKFLVKEYSSGRRVILIVDEAQNLKLDVLEELRVLSNINADNHFVLQTFLVGQPELRDTLQRHELRQFSQRIGADYHLDGIGLEDAVEYVRHRLVVAGGNPDLISAEAVAIAHAASSGLPRLINQLCDTALVYGFADQRPGVDADLMRQVVVDRSSGGIFQGPGMGPGAMRPAGA